MYTLKIRIKEAGAKKWKKLVSESRRTKKKNNNWQAGKEGTGLNVEQSGV